MDESGKRFNKNYLFGKNAESIFEFLVKSMEGYKIIKFGVENHIEELKKNLKGNYTDSAEKIKSMPDFIVLDNNNQIMFFEVKSTRFIDKRQSNKLLFKFQKNSIDRYLKFWSATKLFVVHQEKPYFYIVDLKDIDPIRHKHRENLGKDVKNTISSKRLMDEWNFKDVQKSIKEIFPKIDEDNVKIASTKIMALEPEEIDNMGLDI
ncbi:MAG: hypothetical protein AABW79_00580 [Nanoarchaeota archaeon]